MINSHDELAQIEAAKAIEQSLKALTERAKAFAFSQARYKKCIETIAKVVLGALVPTITLAVVCACIGQVAIAMLLAGLLFGSCPLLWLIGTTLD